VVGGVREITLYRLHGNHVQDLVQIVTTYASCGTGGWDTYTIGLC
jgi:hypothetical protein